jgi:hypothetical protein
MYALEPKDFSLKTLFKYKLNHCFPSKHKRWAPYIQWTFAHNLTPIYGSKIWDEVMKAWKVMVRKMNPPPSLIVSISILLIMSKFGGLQVIKEAPLESQFYGHKNCIGMD